MRNQSNDHVITNGRQNSNQCCCLLFAGQAMLGMVCGECSREKELKTWEFIEHLLKSYAERRDV